MTIKIKKSETADTRTCDWSKVTRGQLEQSSRQHIEDVRAGMEFLVRRIQSAAHHHDHTKLSEIDWFHSDFATGFKETGWWEMHQQKERHHIRNCEPDKVNLIDVLEHIVDCVMAGMARSGEFRFEGVDKDQLERAFTNTISMLLEEVDVEP
jgi:hypothetical protein